MKYIRIILSEPIIIFTFIPSVIFLLIMFLIQKIFLIRIGFLHSNRIGHFAANTELYILKKKHFNIRSYDLFYYGRSEICNLYLAKIWKNHIKILPYVLLRCLDLIIRATPLKNNFSCNNFSNTARDTYGLYEKYLPIIRLNKNEENNFFKKINLTKEDKVVCLNVRDSAYLKTIYRDKKHDLEHYNFRNCDIQNFKTTVNYLLNNGYKVFRIGKEKEKYLDIEHQNFFDKIYSLNREDSTDVFLASICKFCISTGSGFDALPRLFRKPILFVNFIPVIHYHSFCKKDLTICKHLFRKKKLSLNEVFSENIFNGLNSQYYSNKNIKVVENSSIEIMDATQEMLLRIQNKHTYSDENINRQKAIKNIIKENSIDQKLHGKLLSDFGEKYLLENFNV